jgi:hypothetical protein
MASTLADTRQASALGGPLAGLSFVAGVAGATAAADSQYPRPWAEPDEVRKYFTGSASAARLSAAGQLVSSAALIPFTASVARLAGRAGRGAGALRAAAIAGGAFAAATQAASALVSMALTREENDLTRVKKLHRVAFLTGGAVHGVGLGVLAGALGLAGLRSGELPRKLSISSLAVAPAGILSPLGLVSRPTMAVIPAGRFSALIVSGIAGARLSRLPR